MRALERIGGYGHIALRYGLEEAIFLDSIMYWYRENQANGRNYRDGRWWTYNSVSALAQLFPWWSAKQLRRITENCREQGAILAANFNEDQRDRTLWYTPGDELLELYGMTDRTGDRATGASVAVAESTEPDPGQFPEQDTCICPNGPTHLPVRANMLAQTGKWGYDGATVEKLREYAGGSFPEGERWYEAKFSPRKLNDPAKAAKLLGCSTDYLLGLTDELSPLGRTEPVLEATTEPRKQLVAVPQVQEDAIPAETVEALLEEMQASAQEIHPVWLPGVPERSGPVAARFVIPGVGHDMTDLCWYDAVKGEYRFSEDGADIDAECTGWWPVPPAKENGQEQA